MAAVLWVAGQVCGCAEYTAEYDQYEGSDSTAAPDQGTPRPSDGSGPVGDDDDDDGYYDDQGDDDVEDWEPLPTEAPDSFYRTEPAGADLYVFVANPDRDTVTKIEVETQAVYTLHVGEHPTQVVVREEEPRKALVLNEGDSTITIIDTRTDEMTTVPIHQDTNYMVVSPDARYAITYFDERVESADTGFEGVRSFSSISVVYTGTASTPPTSTPVVLALNPRSAVFVPTGDEAVVLCDDALGLVTLSTEPSARVIPLTTEIEEHLDVSELVVSPDGRYAFLRLSNLAELVVVDLETPYTDEAVSRLALPAVPSDMALADDTLVLVDRTDRMLILFDALHPEAEPGAVSLPEDQLVGSIAVTPDGSHAILYTTLTEEDLTGTAEEGTPLNRFSLWDLATDEITLYELVKPVQRVAMGSFESYQVVTFIHDGSADSPVEAFAQEEAVSQFYLEDDLVVPTLFEAPVKGLAESSAGLYQFMILEDDLHVVVVDYATKQLQAVMVQSQPAFVGALTGTETAFVSQEHELGRMSFVDPETLTVSTITGFELNAQP